MSMSGLFSAVSGMRAAQTNLYVTGHNMANHSTRGFTRQMVHQAHFNSRTIGQSPMTGPMQIGMGTSMNGIRQVRDHFLDVRFRETVPRLAYWEVRNGTHSEMDAIFGELEGHYRLHLSLEQLNSALNELINDTPSRDTRSNFVSQANTFIDRANAAQRATFEYQMQLDLDIRRSVQRINQLLTDINHLNQRIMQERNFGQNPNDFMDLRNNALDELATIIDITFIEVPGGSVNVMTAHDGHALLMNGSVHQVGLRQSAPMSPFVEPVFTAQDRVLEFQEEARSLFRWDRLSRNYTVDNGGKVGSLLSMLSSRGLTHTNYRSHPVEEQIDIRNRVDMTGAVSALMPAVVPPSLAGLDALLGEWDDFLTNATFTGFGPPATTRTFEQVVLSSRFERPLDINAQIASEVATHAPGITPAAVEAARQGVAQALADGDITAEEAAQMNAFLNSLTSTRPSGNFAVEIMQDFDLIPMRRFDMNVGVIPRIQSQFDTLVNDMVNMFNNSLTQPFYVDGVYRMPVNQHGHYHGQITPPFSAAEPADLRLFIQIRPGEGYTLGNIILNPIYLEQGGGSHLPLTFAGESDNRLLLHMMNEWNSPRVRFDNWEPKSFNFFYRNMITEMGTGGSEARGDLLATMEEVEMVQHRRMSVSAVSLEEEMSAMIRFQHAYNSSARMISMMDSMLERLVNIGRA
ncbi:MAG: hypothetical protein FWB98_07580 [Defluviitaleaceae bacterium]|nr:hypothetical protein [Defluviitaleaceae bacterium]